MEQRKILWIIAAVGAFLLVIFGFAFITFKGSNVSQNYAQTYSAPRVDESWGNQPDEVAKVTEPANNGLQGFEGQVKTDSLYVVSENTTILDVNKQNTEGTTIDLNSLKKESEVTNGAPNINITLNMPEVDPKVVSTKDVQPVYDYSSVTASEAEKKEKETSVRVKTETSTVKETPKTTSVKTTAPKASTSSTPKKTASTVKKADTPKTSSSKGVTRYWVQVASYTNKKTAENARSTLNNNKILSDIFTYQDGSNKLFYRVRVGPYTTKSEAEYWMSKIAMINDFSKTGSYVTSTIN